MPTTSVDNEQIANISGEIMETRVLKSYFVKSTTKSRTSVMPTAIHRGNVCVTGSFQGSIFTDGDRVYGV